MNEKLIELFNLYKNLRSMQEIVNEILTLDYYVYQYDEEQSISLINYCITKYNKELKLITGIKRDRIVVENDEHLYENKDDIEINSDVEYIRDSLIIIGAVKSGIRNNLRDVVMEVYN